MTVRIVDAFDGGERTPEEKAEIARVGEQVATALSDVSSGEVLMDIIAGMVMSAALNTGADEMFFGVLLTDCMRVFPQFKAGRDARQSGFRQ